MPLKPYMRDDTPYWWARGTIEYNDQVIRKFYRKSTGSLTKNGAIDWIKSETDRQIRLHLFGEEKVITFNDAVLLYECDKTTAKYLQPIVKELGNIALAKISPKMIRNLGPKLYPKNSTETWRRWVIAPTRAVLLNAHDLGLGPPITVKGYNSKEMEAQDEKRGKTSRIKKEPGSWEWILKFRQHAPQNLATLALFMFATGTRIGQAVKMRPDIHLAKLNEGIVLIPGGKNRPSREMSVMPELVAELRQLTARVPRGWNNSPENLRVFGYASKSGYLKSWKRTCELAKIPYLTAHAAGRHGFGQENLVRQGVDAQAVSAAGGWADPTMLHKVYTHSEDADEKIKASLRTGLVQAEEQTSLKLLKEKDNGQDD